jgi:hypothetical protein
MTAGPYSRLDQLQPQADVRVEAAADGTRVLVAEGGDPQLIWRPSRAELAPFERRGAVRVRVRIRALEGRLTEPCVFVDWGDGFGEEGWKPLTLAERGVYVGTANSSAGSLRALRFDPSTQPGRFELTGFDVEPAGPTSAGLRTISPARRLVRKALRKAPPPLRNTLRAARSLITGGASGRRAVAGRSLARELRARFRGGPESA